MSILNLQKGGRLNLSKEVPGLKRVRFGLGWSANNTDTGYAFDLDASAFLIGANGKCPNTDYVVYYGKPDKTSFDGSTVHSGDNLTGDGDGDDEVITVSLNKVNAEIERIVFVATIYEAELRKQNFGQVRDAYIKMYDDETGKEIAKYDLSEDFSAETAVTFGELYKKDGEWRFMAVGQGFNKGLLGYEEMYLV